MRVKITPTEADGTMCGECGERPGDYDVAVVAADSREENVILIAACLPCIANVGGQIGGAVMALIQRRPEHA